MGGVGSGRQGGRPTIEGCASFRLSIQDLRPLLRSRGSGTARVQYRRDDEHLIVVIEFYSRSGQLRLRHPSRVPGHAEGMDYPVDLTRTVLWRDDRQWWFLCPLSGRRCGVLYLPRGASKFASAKGHGLDYAVTRMTKCDQAWRRMAQILAVLVLGAAGAVEAETVLHRGNGGEPETLDPQKSGAFWESNILTNIYEGLVTYAANGELVPGVAESWDISDDQKTYTFHLRKDEKWSNGEPLLAADFVYSFQRAVDPATGGPYASTLAPISNVEALLSGTERDASKLGVIAKDDHTLIITLNGPTPYFLEQLRGQFAMPVPRTAIEKFGAEWTKPENIVSNGAFVLADWMPQQSITLIKNPYYHAADSVNLDKIIFYPTIAKDDHTLIITLNGPTPYFLEQLRGQFAMPVPRTAIEKFGAEWTKPENIVSNGAFVLADWMPQQSITLIKNPYYHAADSVNLDKIIFYPTIAKDDHTLIITLNGPTPYFLEQLRGQFAMPVPRTAIEKFGAEWTKPENIVSKQLLVLRHLPDRGTIEIGWWTESGAIAPPPSVLELAAEAVEIDARLGRSAVA